MSRKKFNPIFILFVVLGIVCGIFGKNMIEYLESNGLSSPFSLLFIMAIFVISLCVVPIIHESGHLFMGLMTGYDFVSFRVGNFAIVKENNKLKKKKFNVVGTGGQCILSYKKVEYPERIPYFWYHFGGVFFNLLTTAICMCVIISSKSIFINVGLGILAAISLVTGITNIIPTKATGIGSDGYNLMIFRKSAINRIANYKIMLINSLQYQGIKLEDMPKEITIFTKEEKSCEFGIALSIIEANILMNQHDFKSAEKIYRSIVENEEAYTLYQNESKCEMLFCMIMNGCSSEEINKIYDNDIRQYIMITEKTYIMRKRLMYAYYLIIEKNQEKAKREYNSALQMQNTYPAKGEYLSEMDLIEYIRENFQHI